MTGTWFALPCPVTRPAQSPVSYSSPDYIEASGVRGYRVQSGNIYTYVQFAVCNNVGYWKQLHIKREKRTLCCHVEEEVKSRM